MFLFENQDIHNFRLFMNFIEEFLLNPILTAADIRDFD